MFKLKGSNQFIDPRDEVVKFPIGLTEFNALCDRIITLADAPQNDSTRRAVATMILQAPSGEDSAPISFFTKALKKSMANEVAFQVIQDVKAAEKAKAEELKQAETPPEALPVEAVEKTPA